MKCAKSLRKKKEVVVEVRDRSRRENLLLKDVGGTFVQAWRRFRSRLHNVHDQRTAWSRYYDLKRLKRHSFRNKLISQEKEVLLP